MKAGAVAAAATLPSCRTVEEPPQTKPKEDPLWKALKGRYKDLDSLMEAVKGGAMKPDHYYLYLAKDSVGLGLCPDFNVTEAHRELIKWRNRIRKATSEDAPAKENLKAVADVMYGKGEGKMGLHTSYSQFTTGHDIHEMTDTVFIPELLNPEKRTGVCQTFGEFLHAVTSGTHSQVSLHALRDHVIAERDGVFFETTARGRQSDKAKVAEESEGRGTRINPKAHLRPLTDGESLAVSLRNRATALAGRKMYSQALADLDRVKSLFKDMYEVDWMAGVVLLSGGQPREAAARIMQGVESEFGLEGRKKLEGACERLMQEKKAETVKRRKKDDASEDDSDEVKQAAQTISELRLNAASGREVALQDDEARLIALIYRKMGLMEGLEEAYINERLLPQSKKQEGEMWEARSYDGIAEAYARHGFRKEAVDWYEKTIRYDREHAASKDEGVMRRPYERGNTHREYGRYLTEWGMPKEALRQFERAEAILSTDPEGKAFQRYVYASRYKAYAALGRYDEALSDIDKWLEKGSFGDVASLEKAKILVAKGQPQMALNWLDQKIEEFGRPDKPEKSGRPDSLRNMLEDEAEAMLRITNLDEYHCLRSICHQRLGHTTEAVQDMCFALLYAQFNKSPTRIKRYSSVLNDIVNAEGEERVKKIVEDTFKSIQERQRQLEERTRKMSQRFLQEVERLSNRDTAR